MALEARKDRTSHSDPALVLPQMRRVQQIEATLMHVASSGRVVGDLHRIPEVVYGLKNMALKAPKV